MINRFLSKINRFLAYSYANSMIAFRKLLDFLFKPPIPLIRGLEGGIKSYKLIYRNDFSAFNCDKPTVDREKCPSVNMSVGPTNFEMINLFRFANTKMGAQIVEGEITPATLHLPILDVCSGYNFDSCADPGTVTFLSDDLNLYPIVSVPDCILEQSLDVGCNW